MKPVFMKMAFLIASVGLFAHAGTVDVGSGSAGKTNLKEDISSRLEFENVYFGNVILKTPKGERETQDACTVFVSMEGDRITVQVLNTMLNRIKPSSPSARKLFSAKNDGSELLIQPNTVGMDGSATELRMTNETGVKIQSLAIRSFEGGRVVSITEKLLGDFDIPETHIACEIE